MSFRLSLELYEFYQWHNSGYTSFLPREEQEFVDEYSCSIWRRFAAIIKFFSLEEALSEPISLGSRENKYIIPIFAWENWSNCALLDSEQRENSPVVDDDFVIGGRISYPSITSMMFAHAERLQSGYLWIY